METIQIYFKQMKQRIAVASGTLLSETFQIAGMPLDLACGGEGLCGKCRVQILRQEGLESVLACQTRIVENVTVLLPEEVLKKQKGPVLTDGEESRRFQLVHFNPAVQKICIEKEKLKLSRENNYFDSLRYQMAQQIKTPVHNSFLMAYPEMKKLDQMLSNQEIDQFTLVLDQREVIDLQVGDTTSMLYGAAIDIGTTTLVMYLYDLTNGDLLGVYSDMNPQTAWGFDVISRIMYGANHENGTEALQNAVIKALNSMIDEAASSFPVLKTNLYQLVMGGNTTMHHLFHGFNPKELGQTPFRALQYQLMESEGKDGGLSCPEKARIVFLPLLGVFVGADTTAVLLSMEEDEQQRLIIDLGTNGEIAVGSRGKYLVASTACGPALEGAGLSCGMMAAPGAVEKVELRDGQVEMQIIGNTLASGLCGSGVVDLMAVLLREGIVDASGRMLDRETFNQRYSDHPLADRLFKIGNINAFMVAPKERSQREGGVYLTQKDIRQIQLAKSAIYTGCLMLLEKAGMCGGDLDEILLAGAFGNYIHVGNAQQIGLIPHFEGVLTRSVGNAAGTGLQQVLLNFEEKKRSEKVARQVVHVELANDPVFQEQYVQHLEFGAMHHA